MRCQVADAALFLPIVLLSAGCETVQVMNVENESDITVSMTVYMDAGDTPYEFSSVLPPSGSDAWKFVAEGNSALIDDKLLKVVIEGNHGCMLELSRQDVERNVGRTHPAMLRVTDEMARCKGTDRENAEAVE